MSVPLRRLEPWLDGFADRHGGWVAEQSEDPSGWALRASDGAVAVVSEPGWLAHLAAGPGVDLSALAGLRPRFGALLVRRAGYAVAAFDGDRLVERKVGSRHVHGRTAAGGWSQQRYARRRDNQADEVAAAAAAAAGRILGAEPVRVAFLVTGGDRPLLAAALADLGRIDRRIAALPVATHLEVGTPDARVLAGIPDRVLAVRIDLVDP